MGLVCVPVFRACAIVSMAARRVPFWHRPFSATAASCRVDRKDKMAASPSSQARTTKKIFVGNLSVDTSAQTLLSHFAKIAAAAGAVAVAKETSVATDRRNSQLSLGYASLSIEHSRSDARAIQRVVAAANDTILDGKRILVSPFITRTFKRLARLSQDGLEQPQLQSQEEDVVPRKTPYTIDDCACPPTHPHVLRNVLTKHCNTLDRYLAFRPLADHTRHAFLQAHSFARQFFGGGEVPSVGGSFDTHGRGIIFDSGCGTARSTIMLGEMYPNDLVIGIDRSLARLSRNAFFQNQTSHVEQNVMGAKGYDHDEVDSNLEEMDQDSSLLTCAVASHPNVFLVRAELSDFWRICLDHGWTLKKHYILYPNPYPKKSQLKNRWYAHPSFPLLLKLGGDIIVRSNWKTYLSEFYTSAHFTYEYLLQINNNDKTSIRDVSEQSCADCQQSTTALFTKPILTDLSQQELLLPTTNFEKKYVACGEAIYEIVLSSNER